MNPHDYDQPLAPWERELLGQHLSTVAVFFHDGESVVFENVPTEGMEFDYKSGLLSWKDGRKDFNVPGVRYWTEQPNY